METIVIDENYNGVYKCDWYFKIDVDIKFPNAKIEIKIPLISSKSIVGESLEVGKWLKVGESLEVGESLSIFGEKTTKYMLLAISTYQVILTTNFIKIGCQLHKVEEWEGYQDKQILAMDGQKALDWWKTWKEFILTTHKNLPETFKI